MKTNPIDSFKKGLFNFSDITENDWVIIKEKISVRELDKGEYLLKQGQICTKVSYIIQGLIRFFLNNDGDEITTNFALENMCAASFSSFINQKPSKENLIALEKTQLIEIDKEDYELFIETIPSISYSYRKALEQAFLDMEDYNYIHKNLEAKERYRILILEKSPQLIQRVPLLYLASYLAITPETLSRIRRTIHHQ